MSEHPVHVVCGVCHTWGDEDLATLCGIVSGTEVLPEGSWPCPECMAVLESHARAHALGEEVSP